MKSPILITAVMMIKNDVIIIGAGPAGMMAAGVAAGRGFRVLLVERNERPGRKLMITGKGRCNVTNNCSLNEFIDNVPCGGKFLYSAFSHFTPADLIEFFEARHVPLKVERGRRVFPVSDKAVDIVDALQGFICQSGCRMIHGRVSALLLENGQVSGVRLESGATYEAAAVVLCTGGSSYPVTGSTGDGFTLAKAAGHTVTPLRASLVPIETAEEWPKALQGLSLRNITLEVYDSQKGKTVYSELGELLFTHFGVSGPLVLSASAHMSDAKTLSTSGYRLRIDLKPALSKEQLDKRLQRDLLKFANRDFINSLGELLPAKLIPVFAALCAIPPQTKSNQITKTQRAAIVELLKGLTLTVKGPRPIEEAIVTSGGVKLSEINPSTMESKLVKGLYFAGEVIDSDGYTGGYNLQIAFSTGHLAGVSVLKERIGTDPNKHQEDSL